MVDWSKYFTYNDGKLFWAYTAKAGRGRVIHHAGEEATGTDTDGYRVISGKKRKSYGSYNTLEEAKAVRDRVMKEIEESKDGE